MKGIEPSYSAWEAAALPLSYTRQMVSRDRRRAVGRQAKNVHPGCRLWQNRKIDLRIPTGHSADIFVTQPGGNSVHIGVLPFAQPKRF